MTQPRTLEEIADEAMLNSVRATDNMQWCNSVKAVILAALREATDEARDDDEVERLKGGWEAAASKEIERSDALSRAELAEAEASEHESRANRWMVQAQHAEAELAIALERAGKAEAELAAERESHAKTAKQFVDEHSLAGSLEIQLAAERERAEKLGKALRGLIGYQGTWSVEPDTPYGRAVAAAREALRPAAPEAKESDCTCGEQWPCPLHGGPPAAPEPTHSCQPGNYPDCCDPTSEQPDLPLGHEFWKGRSRHDECRIIPNGWQDRCGQPESAHRRKP